MLTAKCRDGNVRIFWEQQYDKMPKDASMAVLTKLYRIVQERILVPIFMAEKSCFNFRVATDEQKIIIVDLPEGVITSDMANFLGSLILSATYNAGMSREDTTEEKRVPFYVYVDETYRYTTQSIPETLQALRKFKVYMTLTSQYLTQYRKDIKMPSPKHAKPSSASCRQRHGPCARKVLSRNLIWLIICSLCRFFARFPQGVPSRLSRGCTSVFYSYDSRGNIFGYQPYPLFS